MLPLPYAFTMVLRFYYDGGTIDAKINDGNTTLADTVKPINVRQHTVGHCRSISEGSTTLPTATRGYYDEYDHIIRIGDTYPTDTMVMRQ